MPHQEIRLRIQILEAEAIRAQEAENQPRLNMILSEIDDLYDQLDDLHALPIGEDVADMIEPNLAHPGGEGIREGRIGVFGQGDPVPNGNLWAEELMAQDDQPDEPERVIMDADGELRFAMKGKPLVYRARKDKRKEVKVVDDSKIIKYFDGDILAANVWRDKYRLDGEETPNDMFNRLASELHRIEMKYPNPMSIKEIKTLLDKFQGLILGGSNMFGIGNNQYTSSLGNCFVIGNDHDSYGGIMQLDQELVQIMKRRGGVGLDISHLRPNGEGVKNSAKTSTGAVSFAPRFSNSTLEVAQSGRRGALMLTMDFTHTDSDEFIKMKADLEKVTGANISVRINDNYMEELVFIFDENNKKNRKYAEGIHRQIRDRFIALAENAHKSAEPGVLFFDRITKLGPADQYPGFKSTSTNPCGELPLPPYDSCRLASIVTYFYVDKPFTAEAEFMHDEFARDVEKAQRLMDNIVDLELEKIQLIKDKIAKDPEPDNVKQVELDLWNKIEKKCSEGRRTGLGMTGIADTLAALGLNYCSTEGNKFVEELSRTFGTSSYKSSIIMAEERGAFPIFNHEIEFGHEFIERILTELDDITGIAEKYAKYGRRNIANMAIAPTGSISILAGTTSGIEPVFKIYYNRRRRIDKAAKVHKGIGTFVDEKGDRWEEYKVVHKPFLALMKAKHDLDSTKVLAMDDKALDALIAGSIYHKNDAHSIDPFKKATMQGLAQLWIDHSISVTYNLPKDTTVETILQLYLHAYKSGCKGATVYRDGSRHGILTSTKSKETTEVFVRPQQTNCKTHFTTIKGEKWIVMVGLLKNKPVEVFAFKTKDIDGDITEMDGFLTKIRSKRYDLLDKGGNIVVANITSYFGSPEEEYITRFISTMLQNNISIEKIYEQIIKPKSSDITSFAKGIARVLSKYVDMESISVKETCPNCGSDLKMAEGCITCMSCGYSRC